MNSGREQVLTTKACHPSQCTVTSPDVLPGLWNHLLPDIEVNSCRYGMDVWAAWLTMYSSDEHSGAVCWMIPCYDSGLILSTRFTIGRSANRADLHQLVLTLAFAKLIIHLESSLYKITWLILECEHQEYENRFDICRRYENCNSLADQTSVNRQCSQLQMAIRFDSSILCCRLTCVFTVK